MADVDLSEFEELTFSNRRDVCIVADVARRLSPAERRKLLAALAESHKKISAPAIRRWLGNLGHDVSATSVRSHRRGECPCDRPK